MNFDLSTIMLKFIDPESTSNSYVRQDFYNTVILYFTGLYSNFYQITSFCMELRESLKL